MIWPTDAAENERWVDALIQFKRGKWANVSQEKIPASIVREALAAFNPDEKLTFNTWKRGGPGGGIGYERPRQTPGQIRRTARLMELASRGGRAAALARNARMTDADRKAWSAKMLAIRWARRA